MIRAALLALALALGGGAPYFGVLLDLATTKAGGHADPNGGSTNGDLGTTLDPDGASANSDAGNHNDPDG
jgi:hypothetical protein